MLSLLVTKRAVEPLVRESLTRLLPDPVWPETEAVGGWWNQQNTPEIDLVGADREPVAGAVQFVGSVAWLENQPFDALAVPGAGADTSVVAVSRSGVADGLPLAAVWGPEELVDAWRSPSPTGRR